MSLVSELAQELKITMDSDVQQFLEKWSSQMNQEEIEDRLIQRLELLRDLAQHAHRKKIQMKDLKLIVKIQS